jgi:hypothetical protein
MFFAALAARGEQPFVANRRGSALSAQQTYMQSAAKVGNPPEVLMFSKKSSYPKRTS